jgi:hypothetical protein
MTDASDNMTRMYPQALLKQFRHLGEVPNWASFDINAKFDSDINWYFEVCRTANTVVQPPFPSVYTNPNRELVTLQINSKIFFELSYTNTSMVLASSTHGIIIFGTPSNKLTQIVLNF